MTRWGSAVLALAGVAACDAPQGAAPGADAEPASPAVEALANADVPTHYAALRLTNRIAAACPRYAYDRIASLDINEQRNREGRGSFSAIGRGAEIDAATDALFARTEAAYSVDVQSDDLCAVGDAERAKGTAASALLVPV